jgi:hypothetical protein
MREAPKSGAERKLGLEEVDAVCDETIATGATGLRRHVHQLLNDDPAATVVRNVHARRHEKAFLEIGGLRPSGRGDEVRQGLFREHAREAPVCGMDTPRPGEGLVHEARGQDRRRLDVFVESDGVVLPHRRGPRLHARVMAAENVHAVVEGRLHAEFRCHLTRDPLGVFDRDIHEGQRTVGAFKVRRGAQVLSRFGGTGNKIQIDYPCLSRMLRVPADGPAGQLFCERRPAAAAHVHHPPIRQAGLYHDFQVGVVRRLALHRHMGLRS